MRQRRTFSEWFKKYFLEGKQLIHAAYIINVDEPTSLSIQIGEITCGRMCSPGQISD